MEGQLVCYRHGGAAPQNKHKAEVRKTVEKIIAAKTSDDTFLYGVHPTVDPGEIFLQMISDWWVRAQAIAVAVQQLVERHGGNLEKALTADTWLDDGSGNAVKTGEHVRGLVDLEFRVIAQVAAWAQVAVKNNLEERRVIIAERNAAEFQRMMKLLLADKGLALTEDQRAEVPLALERVIQQQAA